MHEFQNGPGMTRRSYRSPDGRFTFTSTTFSSRGSTPQRQQNPYDGGMPFDPLMPVLRSFDTIFRGLTDTYQNQNNQNQNQNPRPRPTETRPAGNNYPPRRPSETHEYPDPEEEYPGSRNVYPPPEGLWPRDADHPQPMQHPLGNINEYGPALILFPLPFLSTSETFCSLNVPVVSCAYCLCLRGCCLRTHCGDDSSCGDRVRHVQYPRPLPDLDFTLSHSKYK